MKKFYLLSLAALALTACTSDEIIDPVVGPNGPAESGDPISFGSKTGVITRATGAEAAAQLGNSFVVYGYKTNPNQVVYDHYTVKYVDGSSLSTPSNSAGWEYVNQTLNMLTSLDKANGAEQSIKYWDQAADSYDFIAFSIGEQTSAGKLTQVPTAPSDNQVQISKITTTSGPTYTITGKMADIAKVYIADRVTAKKTKDATLHTSAADRQVAYKEPVKFNFHSAVAKVRMGIYETIPGYSVKDVKFYEMGASEATKLADAKQHPTLFGNAATIANSSAVVTATVTFPNTTVTSPDYNKAVLSLPDAAKSKNMTFGDLSAAAAEHKEDAGSYLGRTSATASISGKTASNEGYVNVFPCNAGALTLKVDYTLVSRDGSAETIKVTGATATVPAKFGDWKPNYAYTYIFKISDNTNGEIGGEVGLYPITFDAIVTETEDGVQETITEVTTPSITTYQAGKVVTANNEYTAGRIYVAVEGTPALTVGTNANLYTVTIETGAAQGITEESVANAIAQGTHYYYEAVSAGSNLTAGNTYYTNIQGAGQFVEPNPATHTSVAADTYFTATTEDSNFYVIDANGKKMTVTPANTSLAASSTIPAADAPDGKDMTINCAKITATAGTVYVFEYINSGTKTYKVIKVAAGS